MAFSVIKLISILYQYFILLMMFLLVLGFIECLWELIGLLSDYHNIDKLLIGKDTPSEAFTDSQW